MTVHDFKLSSLSDPGLGINQSQLSITPADLQQPIRAQSRLGSVQTTSSFTSLTLSLHPAKISAFKTNTDSELIGTFASEFSFSVLTLMAIILNNHHIKQSIVENL